MNNPKNPITGIIETDSNTFTFYLNNYTVTFMDTTVEPYNGSRLKSVDSFARATSHNRYKMLIHIGEHDFPVVNSMKMGLASYIVSTSNVFDYDISFYDGIVFVGGTLSSLKHPQAMKINYDEESQKKFIEYNDDAQRVTFSADDFTCDVTIRSITTENYSSGSTSIANGTICFEMIFDRSQGTSTIYRHYNKICELMSFLTNRKNVGFDEMYLLQKDIPIGERKTTQKVARVFIEQEKEFTKKRQYHNLEFDKLGNSLANLLEILYTTKERKRSYSLGFYPENDAQENTITNGMVRSVCSALECELEFVKTIKVEEEKKIKELRDKIKPIIDEHKKSAEKLREKTYSLIETSMSHWSMAASDQFKALYHMYDEEMAVANKSSFIIGDDEIDAFVKYRNDITHGSYRVLDIKIAYTTHLMSCLVYCCMLTRIGVPRGNILQWFKDGRLLR